MHEVEGKVFRQLQDLGRHFLSRFVQLCGTGYEANGFKEQGKGQKMRYKVANRSRICPSLGLSPSVVPPMPVPMGAISTP